MTFSRGLRWGWCTALMAASAASVACSGPPVERKGPTQERSVRRTWNETLPLVRSAVIEAFGQNRRALPDPFNQMIASELTLPRYSPDWLVGYVDPGDFLKDYKALAPVTRSKDLWVEDPIGDT